MGGRQRQKGIRNTDIGRKTVEDGQTGRDRKGEKHAQEGKDGGKRTETDRDTETNTEKQIQVINGQKGTRYQMKLFIKRVVCFLTN